MALALAFWYIFYLYLFTFFNRVFVCLLGTRDVANEMQASA